VRIETGTSYESSFTFCGAGSGRSVGRTGPYSPSTGCAPGVSRRITGTASSVALAGGRIGAG